MPAKKFFALLLAAVAFSTSGCLVRTITRVDDVPGKNATVMETLDKSLFSRTHQFWTCTEDQSAITCQKTCGGETDLACHQMTLGYADNLR